MRARRPPLRTCPRCGREHRAWQEFGPCPPCRTDAAEHQSEVAAMAREDRLKRREPDTRPPLGSSGPLVYGQMPEGF